MADRKRSVKKQSAKTKKEPSPLQVYNKVNAVSESTKALSKEIKGMAKIFKDNQNILVSMSDMMESISLAICYPTYIKINPILSHFNVFLLLLDLRTYLES